MSNEPREVKLPDSGATVRVKFVGPLLMGDIDKAARKGLTKPKPPLQYPWADNPTRGEENWDDEHYLGEMAEYTREVGVRILRKLVRYGVEYDLTADDQAKLAELRADGDLELPENDVQAFVACVLVSTAKDLEALQNAITAYAQPTGPEVEAATESFPSKV